MNISKEQLYSLLQCRKRPTKITSKWLFQNYGLEQEYDGTYTVKDHEKFNNLNLTPDELIPLLLNTVIRLNERMEDLELKIQDLNSRKLDARVLSDLGRNYHYFDD